MEQIMLANVMECFGNALGRMKNVIGEIEDEMKEQSTTLKNEKSSSAIRSRQNESVIPAKTILRHEIDERISQLKEEVELLEKMKQLQLRIENGGMNSDSLSEIYNLSFDSSAEEDTGYSSREEIHQPQFPIYRSFSDPVLYHCCSSNADDNSTVTREWCQTDEYEEYRKGISIEPQKSLRTYEGVNCEESCSSEIQELHEICHGEEDYVESYSSETQKLHQTNKDKEEVNRRKSCHSETEQSHQTEEEAEEGEEEIDMAKEQFERTRIKAYLTALENQQTDSEESGWKPSPYNPDSRQYSERIDNRPSSRPPSEYSTSSAISNGKSWWKLDEPEAHENVSFDWDEEEYERKRYRACLRVTTGYKNILRTRVEIEQTLRKYTGKDSPWTIDKCSYPKSTSACVLVVRCRTCEDAQEILNLWGEQDEFDGLLDIDLALTRMEKDERRRMKWMSRRLRDQGYNVVFEDKRIRVDGAWWKYCWGEGWARV